MTKRVRCDGELGDVATDLVVDDADVTAGELLKTDSNKRVCSAGHQVTLQGADAHLRALTTSSWSEMRTAANLGGSLAGNHARLYSTLNSAQAKAYCVSGTNPTTASLDVDSDRAVVEVMHGTSSGRLYQEGKTTVVDATDSLSMKGTSALSFMIGDQNHMTAASSGSVTLTSTPAGAVYVGNGATPKLYADEKDTHLDTVSAGTVELRVATVPKFSCTASATTLDNAALNLKVGGSSRIGLDSTQTVLDAGTNIVRGSTLSVRDYEVKDFERIGVASGSIAMYAKDTGSIVLKIGPTASRFEAGADNVLLNSSAAGSVLLQVNGATRVTTTSTGIGVPIDNGLSLNPTYKSDLGAYSIYVPSGLASYGYSSLRIATSCDAANRRHTEFGYFPDDNPALTWTPGVAINHFSGQIFCANKLGSVALASVTTAEKGSLSTTAGNICFDSTLGKLSFFDGSVWRTVTSS